MKAVLFDIDGTLMIGHGAGTRAMTRAGRAVCGEAFDLAGIMIGGGLDPVIFHEAALGMGVVDPFALHDAFRDRYLEELQAELIAAEQQPHVLPGVLNLLEQLAERDDVAIGLVTGNYQRAVDAIVVGDTPRDVDCALRNGCRCLAVATGGHSLAELQQTGAQRAVPDLSDPDVLLSWL
jgi:phosphoglycolate phosphatase-like HAD superfamily hydrolase